MSTKFKVGDKIVLVDAGNYEKNDGNPVWGWNDKFVSGKIEDIDTDDFELTVEWDNGFTNNYYETNCKLELLTKNQPVKVGTGKLDLKMMNDLILDADKKSEIISVLKQHENSKLIFDEWGLGEVIEYGRGMTLLFWGGPGTGKTWAARCIAKTLGAELLSIGAAEIQTSEPGGANRAIMEAFNKATEEGKVLFLDECDSLIATRDNVGMILASEINTLLTEIEKFEGVLILSTNRANELDEALERRISLILEFPNPDFTARKLIWERMLPKKMPVGKGVTAEKLAEHNLTGGQIKNVLLNAARSAAGEQAKVVEAPYFEKAIARLQASSGQMGKPGVRKNVRYDYGRSQSSKSIDRSKAKEGADIDLEVDKSLQMN